MAVTGFRNSRDVAGFLKRAGWPGQPAAVVSTVSQFEEPERFASLGVHLDVHADGLGRTLGLSFLAKERMAKDSRYWLDEPRLWMPFIDVLAREGLVVRDKLAALTGWSPGPTTLFGACLPRTGSSRSSAIPSWCCSPHRRREAPTRMSGALRAGLTRSF